MMKPKRTKTPGPKTPARHFSSSKDPIVVYCRIRPIFTDEKSCVQLKDSQTLILSPPEDSQPFRPAKEGQYTFSYVFDEGTTQKHLFNHVAMPLVQDLLQGSNGLLFTYGVTSSGKTYTMTGSPDDGGLLPRTLDVIFNSITNYQAEKYIFKPDRFNGFIIQTNSEALEDRSRERPTYLASCRTPSRQRVKENNEWSRRNVDSSIIEDVSSDSRYAVFISYIEIYNKYIYDLLEDIGVDSNGKRNFNSKLLREDTNNNMYVHQVSENEVKSVEEALELFRKGQIRRTTASTALNADSSRSHSVFTIRVVQAPLDSMGKDILQDSGQITTSQFSLVDLAGSERTKRTKCTAQKNFQEAGNINNSLITLRSCIEALRNAQNQNGVQEKPRYRDSKLTHLFKSFFEGEGRVRMVVCLNPREDDYGENLQVLRFAEVTQEVLIARPTPVSTPAGLRSGRGRDYHEAIQRAKEHGLSVADFLAPTVYCLPEFPVNLLEDEESCDGLIEFLVTYMERKQRFRQDMERREAEFRMNLIEVDNQNSRIKSENTILNKDLQARNEQVFLMEKKIAANEEKMASLEKQIDSLEKQLFEAELQLGEKDDIISQQNHEMHKMRAEMQKKLTNEKVKMTRMMEKKLTEKQLELERKLCFNGEKFRQLKDILNAGDWNDLIDMDVPAGPSAGPSEVSVPTTRSRKRSSLSESSTTEVKMLHVSRSANDLIGVTKRQRSQPQSQTPSKEASRNDFDTLFAKENKPPGSSQRSIAIANLRHRRSQSSSGDVWVEHKPVGNLELNTVLQPKMKKRRSVTKLKVKDVTNKDASKYVLEHQEQDSQGDLETQLYKGDIIPSAGGGAQVVFNDVEKLRQESPPTANYNFRKRSSEGLPLREIEDRCTVAVECHGLPSKVMKKK